MISSTKPSFHGKSFAIVGELIASTKTDTEHAIRRSGGIVHGVITQFTDYVVIGRNPGRAIDDAMMHNCIIIGEFTLSHLLDLKSLSVTPY